MEVYKQMYLPMIGTFYFLIKNNWSMYLIHYQWAEMHNEREQLKYNELLIIHGYNPVIKIHKNIIIN